MMKATLEAFLQSLQKLSREQLIQKLVHMKENEMPDMQLLTFSSQAGTNSPSSSRKKHKNRAN